MAERADRRRVKRRRFLVDYTLSGRAHGPPAALRDNVEQCQPACGAHQRKGPREVATEAATSHDRRRATLAGWPVRWAFLVAAYAAATVVMTWPIFNFAGISTANYEGDARLIDLDAGLGQSRSAPAPAVVREQHLLSGSKQPRLQQAPVWTEPVHAPRLRGNREPRPRLQPRVVAGVPAERPRDARAASALCVQRSRGVYGQHHFHVLFLQDASRARPP